MARERLVVVGNGMAAARALEHLLELAPERYATTVFGAEPHPNYNRILLSPVLAGELTLREIILNDLAWYRERGIHLHTSRRIVEIDRARRRVLADDGTAEPYDRLVLATGSMPVMLPIPGNALPGVLTYRDIADTSAMIEAAREYRRAVVIGGGLLGLEAAHGLRRRGMDVSVVHLMDWLMERQLDRDAGELLKTALEKKGLEFHLGKRTAEIFAGARGRVAGVRLETGESLAADLVVMAVGIRPNTTLAESSGLHCRRGIVVSDTMQTYDPRIYAVGECVSHRGVAYGLVAPLYEMARVCALHLAGLGIGRYEGATPSTRLKVTGIEAFSAGDFAGGEGTETLTFRDPARGIYKKAVLKAGRLVGALLFGEAEDAAWLTSLITSGKDVSPMRDALLFGGEIAQELSFENPLRKPLARAA